MDTVKIGKYIAGKRKALGMTQAQVAEKLGMSDKSVSKWERGVCLPDVSVYMALCEILGISLNEFIAGEDIEPAEVVHKSEENLIQVTEDGEYRKRKLKKIIVLLAIFGGLLAVILIYLLVFKDQPKVNYIEPLAKDSTEVNIASMVSNDNEAYLYRYVIGKDINRLSIKVDVYKKGIYQGDIFGSAKVYTSEETSIKEGIIAVIPDYDNGKVKAIIAGEGTKAGTEFDVLDSMQDKSSFGRVTKEIEGKTVIQPEKNMGLMALFLSKNEVRPAALSDVKVGNIDSCNDEVYYLTVTFEKDDEAWN